MSALWTPLVRAVLRLGSLLVRVLVTLLVLIRCELVRNALLLSVLKEGMGELLVRRQGAFPKNVLLKSMSRSFAPSLKQQMNVFPMVVASGMVSVTLSVLLRSVFTATFMRSTVGRTPMVSRTMSGSMRPLIMPRVIMVIVTAYSVMVGLVNSVVSAVASVDIVGFIIGIKRSSFMTTFTRLVQGRLYSVKFVNVSMLPSMSATMTSSTQLFIEWLRMVMSSVRLLLRCGFVTMFSLCTTVGQLPVN